MAPQRYLQEARFDPCAVHLLYVFGRVALLGEERLQRERHREHEGEEVADGMWSVEAAPSVRFFFVRW